MREYDYDVLVVGGGSAGTAAARAAVEAGARTAMINDGELGGLCILRGCMPTKAMLASAHALHETRQLGPLGIRFEGTASPDFAAIMRRKDAQVARFKRAKIESIERQDYEVIAGRGRFVEGGGLRVGDRVLEARRYVLATGSVPVLPQIPGIDDVPVLTSDDVMRLESPPVSLLVQGAGAIGLELAQFFARIGTQVTLVNRSPLLARYDRECGEELRRALAEEMTLLVPGRIVALRREAAGLVATIDAGGAPIDCRADALLAASGRRAALDGLDLQHVGLAARDCRVAHDDTLRTENPAIYVAGDVTGDNQILHLATQEGTVAGFNAARKDETSEPRRIDLRLKMSVIFTDPCFAQVGAVRDEVLLERRGAIVGRARFPETGRAITMEVRHGLWKLFAEPEGGQLLGASILGPRADDLIHLIAVMMHCRLPAAAIGDLPWYHPTLSEVLLNVCRDIASQFRGCDVPPMPPA